MTPQQQNAELRKLLREALRAESIRIGDQVQLHVTVGWRERAREALKVK